ncbi:MAG: DinB family protein [Candidatus Krumholzibacteria bacterium]|nr:DinB family protein [Candidatus Krumholzibacteria bacterium]
MHSDTLVHQFSITSYVIKKNIEGSTHEESLRQPDPAGNNLNWVVGHIVRTRNQALALVGKEHLFEMEKFESYDKTPITDPAKAIRLEELVEMFDALEKPLFDGIKEMPADAFAASAPFSPTGNPDETVGSLLSSIAFHEAYHAGQTGLLRRLAGKSGALQAPA